MSAAKRSKPVHAIDSTGLMPIVKERHAPAMPLQARIVEYLTAPAVWRSPTGEATLPFGAARVSQGEQQRQRAAFLQATVDDCLRRILDGENPRKVFAKPRGLKPSERRSQAATFEVERLIADDVNPTAAVFAAAKRFSATTRTVERWRKSFGEWAREAMPEYIATLRAAGKLPPT